MSCRGAGCMMLAGRRGADVDLTPYYLNVGKCRHTACEKYGLRTGTCDYVSYEYDTDCDQPRNDG